MKIIAVIPAYNESKTIGWVVKEVKEKVDMVVVVDDGSSDQTNELAKKAGAAVLKHFLNRGQGAALQTGIIFALGQGADIIITFDADGQHDANDIERMVQPLLLDEVDVVLGSRFLKPKAPFDSAQGRQSPKPKVKSGIPISKRILLKIATWLTRLYTGLPITDVHNGFRGISRKAAELIEIKQDGMAHASEIIEQIKKHQLKFKEMPVNVIYTDYTRKKGQPLTNSFKIIWDLIFGRINK